MMVIQLTLVATERLPGICSGISFALECEQIARAGDGSANWQNC